MTFFLEREPRNFVKGDSRDNLAEKAFIANFGLLPIRNFWLKPPLRRVLAEGDASLEYSTGRLNPLTDFVLPAMLWADPIQAELECSCLSASIFRFWQSLNTKIDIKLNNAKQPLEDFIKEFLTCLNYITTYLVQDIRKCACIYFIYFAYFISHVYSRLKDCFHFNCLYRYWLSLLLTRKKRKRKPQRRSFVSSAKNSSLKSSSLNRTTIPLLLTIKEEKHHVYKGTITT